MKKTVIIIILLCVAAAIVCGLCGCATVDADIKFPDGTQAKIKTVTLMKDMRIDPNDGAMSVVSPQSPGIIEAAAGFIAGFAVFGL